MYLGSLNGFTVLKLYAFFVFLVRFKYTWFEYICTISFGDKFYEEKF